MTRPERVVIIGSGPTGLGAAYRLHELGLRAFTVLEARDHPGGLASSYRDRRGFTWDVGGHVQFSHYRYYDEVLDRALGENWLHHERESWIWIRKRFVPYPLQSNLHRLPPREREQALRGLEAAAGHRKSSENFGEWIESMFGAGLCEIFMEPYNRKVWGYPLQSLGVEWMGERVAVPELDRIRASLRTGQDNLSWGPNRTFRFPERGGTGAIWKGVYQLLRPDCFRFSSEVTAVDTRAHSILTADGSRLEYDALISTMPLDRLCGLCSGLGPGLSRAASSLIHSSTHILGIGLQGPRPPTLKKKCWMYFPEPDSPYYRVTVFSNYSPHNVPAGSGYWSLMAEVCETPVQPVDADSLADEVVAALRRDQLLDPATRVVSVWRHREEYGYPTPFLGRNEVLAALQARLESARIYSRGRFGAWLYEVSNQDHSFMQGVEVVDRLLGDGRETTLTRPEFVNSGALKQV